MTNYTICVFTSNSIGLLNRITIIFTRRRINIESLTVSETERKGVSRFTIVIKHESRDEVEKLVRQIRKIVEVLAVFGYLNDEIVYNEIALYKLSTPSAANHSTSKPLTGNTKPGSSIGVWITS